MAVEGVAVAVYVSEAKVELVLYVNVIVFAFPPLGFTSALRVVVVSPIFAAAIIVSTGKAIGVKDRMFPLVTPTEFVAITR
jgi:hypothetical protein